MDIPHFVNCFGTCSDLWADHKPDYPLRWQSTLRHGIYAGRLLNIILDPVFIFVFRWGMMGAAVATVLGQALTVFLSVWYLLHMKAIQLEKKSFRLRGKLMGAFLPLRLCSFLSQISLATAMAAMNNMIYSYSTGDPIWGQPQYAQTSMSEWAL